MDIENIINKKITKLEAQIKEASTEPIGFGIYNLEGWLAQVKILEELLREIKS